MSAFHSTVEKFAARSRERVRNTRRAFIAALFQSVADQTPVDSGLLRANWQAASVSPPQGQCELRSEGALRAEIASAAEALHDRDGEVFLVNNLPYARAVEYGAAGGGAAPAAMLRGALAEAPGLLNQAAGKVK